MSARPRGERTQQAKHYMDAYFKANGYHPTVRQVADELGVVVSLAKYHMDKLRALGMVILSPKEAARQAAKERRATVPILVLNHDTGTATLYHATCHGTTPIESLKAIQNLKGLITVETVIAKAVQE